MPAIHVDTDLGGDIDDLCALAMVLKRQGATLLAVTMVLEDGGAWVHCRLCGRGLH